MRFTTQLFQRNSSHIDALKDEVARLEAVLEARNAEKEALRLEQELLTKLAGLRTELGLA